MEFTTRFGLHCQATRLPGRRRREGAPPARAWHPLWASHAREDSRGAPVPARHRPERYSSPRARAQGVSALGSSRFTRRYWGSPRWFPFLRLLKCFSSAGTLVRYEVGARSTCRGAANSDPPVRARSIRAGLGESAVSPTARERGHSPLPREAQCSRPEPEPFISDRRSPRTGNRNGSMRSAGTPGGKKAFPGVVQRCDECGPTLIRTWPVTYAHGRNLRSRRRCSMRQLQFTRLNTAGRTLHRRASQVIHRQGLFCSLHAAQLLTRRPRPSPGGRGRDYRTGASVCRSTDLSRSELRPRVGPPFLFPPSDVILPKVHLR